MNLWAYIAKRVLLMLPTLLGVVARGAAELEQITDFIATRSS